MDEPEIKTLHPTGSYNDRIVGEVITRKLIRPKINYIKSALLTVSVLACSAIVGIIAYLICKVFLPEYVKNFSPAAAGVVAAFLNLVIVLFFTRKLIIIWFIHIYQRYASDTVRLRCLYTPSCSEYMELAVSKYGVIRGLIKGIKRLKRCRRPNGGEDYP